MTPLDILLLLGWFIIGMVVFQVHGVKDYWGRTNDAYSAIGMVPLILGFFYGAVTLQNMTMVLIGSIILGFLFTLAYLIGANISRAMQFGEMSPRIILYIFLLIIFLIGFKGII